jgi:Lectin C-type domain
LLLASAACGGPASSGLFDVSAGHSAGTSEPTGGSSSGHAGSSSGTSAVGGSMPSAGTGMGGAPTGGTGPSGGAGSGGSAGSSLGGGGTGGALGDCSTFDAAAKYDAETKHCYLVVHEDMTFAAAESHCIGLHAHLVTLADQAENDFVWNLDGNEHWIGATDGKSVKEPSPGNYQWVDGEPFSYNHWSSGQPNATQVNCTDGSGNCYEHCAFQWSGGGPGEWNDQLCTNVRGSVCEWDH